MRIVFLGTGDIGLPSLKMLLGDPRHEVAAVVTQPDKPAGRKMELRPSPIKLAALEHGIPVLQPEKIRQPAVIESLRAFAPEVIVVMAYGQILSRALLELPSIACLNLHASILPRWRGAAPIQAGIEAGDTESGITVMYMAEGLDTGDILLIQSLPIRRRETGGSLHDRLADLAPLSLRVALDAIAAGDAPRMPQQEEESSYAAKLSRQAGAIDWHAPAEVIARKIRAMNPWPAANTLLPGADGALRQLKVFSCILHRKSSGAPGEVLAADRNGLLVAAGTGAILLRDVQLEGKRRMGAGDLLRGHPIAPGTVLPSAE